MVQEEVARVPRPDVVFQLDDRQQSYVIGLFPDDLFVKILYDPEAYKLARGSSFWGPQLQVSKFSDFLRRFTSVSLSPFREFIAQSMVEIVASGGQLQMKGTGGTYLGSASLSEDAVWGLVSLATEQEEAEAVKMMEAWATMAKPKTSRASRTETCFTVLGDSVDSLKLPRQAKEVWRILKESGATSIPESTVESLMVRHGERLKTKQPPMRIFKYYEKPLIEAGCLTTEAVTSAVEESDEAPSDS